MITTLRAVAVALALSVLAPSLLAATYVVPPDAEMIQTSDDIVIATGVSALSERDANGSIVTRYTLRVVESLKGGRAAGEHLVLTELGGVVGDAASAVAGSANAARNGTWFGRNVLDPSCNADAAPARLTCRHRNGAHAFRPAAHQWCTPCADRRLDYRLTRPARRRVP